MRVEITHNSSSKTQCDDYYDGSFPMRKRTFEEIINVVCMFVGKKKFSNIHSAVMKIIVKLLSTICEGSKKKFSYFQETVLMICFSCKQRLQ